MFIFSILTHAEFGLNDHREDAPRFNILKWKLKTDLFPLEVLNSVELVAFKWFFKEISIFIQSEASFSRPIMALENGP